MNDFGEYINRKENYANLPLVWISKASTSSLSRSSAVAITSLTYVIAPESTKRYLHEFNLQKNNNPEVKGHGAGEKRQAAVNSLILSYGQTGRQRPQP